MLGITIYKNKKKENEIETGLLINSFIVKR